MLPFRVWRRDGPRRPRETHNLTSSDPTAPAPSNKQRACVSSRVQEVNIDRVADVSPPVVAARATSPSVAPSVRARVGGRRGLARPRRRLSRSPFRVVFPAKPRVSRRASAFSERVVPPRRDRVSAVMSWNRADAKYPIRRNIVHTPVLQTPKKHGEYAFVHPAAGDPTGGRHPTDLLYEGVNLRAFHGQAGVAADAPRAPPSCAR